MRMWSSWTSWKTWRSLLIVCVVGWACYVAAMNALVVYFAKDLADETPAVKLMPTSLNDTRIADLSSGTTISRFGYTIRVPWPSPFKTLDFKGASSFRSDDGSSLLFFDPASHVNAREMYKRSSLVEGVLGPQAMSSGYQLFQASMLSSPDEIKLWHSRAANVRVMLLVNEKQGFVLTGTEIHPIAGEHVRGFETVAVDKGRRIVRLELFDDKDRELELMLAWTPGKASELTQAQINAMVASIEIPIGGCTAPGLCS
jgi:hypothetical protein